VLERVVVIFFELQSLIEKDITRADRDEVADDEGARMDWLLCVRVESIRCRGDASELGAGLVESLGEVREDLVESDLDADVLPRSLFDSFELSAVIAHLDAGLLDHPCVGERAVATLAKTPALDDVLRTSASVLVTFVLTDIPSHRAEECLDFGDVGRACVGDD